ncbi:glycosyltransferase [Gluconacetobacter sp. 1b LMG 1731]|uniref:Glycosyltransferase n=1 Tax=Gluconacetobacter dulcium TaxID=2729096 RepID=A0A7W4IIY0_9PROT|nr:glycosyltransferase [Gluconacetobacter dulcium]MBB2163564.1 glycosyltransferase [Gluconacetobacter dulcium]MBB2193022.1 glycosyltransferase [Gluconacetobacter dulcium]
MKEIRREEIVSTLLRFRAGKFYKSGGVWVSKALSRTMKGGNAARDKADWDAAARHFREAVAIDGTIPHIWIQLGHALNELGDHKQGLEAYRTALLLDPSKGECYLHIGRRLAEDGDVEKAIEAYKSALPFEDVSASAEQEIIALRPSFAAFLRQKETVKAIAADIRPGTVEARYKIASEEATLCFDVSDLIAHFRHNKFPTGIQRVQIEVVAEAVATCADRVEIFFFVDGVEHFIDVDHPTFTLLATLCKNDDQEAWTAARDGFFARIPFSQPYLPPHGAIVVNLGTSWWMYNYFLAIRNLKRERDITFVPYVHDLIPAIKPQYCVEGVTIDYNTWLVGVFFHADAFITNSTSTTRDLIYAARVMGHPLNERNVATIPLSARFSGDDEGRALPSEALIRRWGLQAEGYVLFVSTIEARKNHEAAFLAWQALLQKNGADAVPPLVCVGKFGWLNDRAMSVIAADPSLSSKIVFIQRASDLELKSLYRLSLFTVYPSHYEGWGLPITESLSYGRVPLVADNSSLVEAAAGYGVVFESGNVTDFVEKAEKLLFDTKFRAERERQITEHYHLTTWRTMTHEIVAFSDSVKTSKGSLYEGFPKLLGGRYVPLNLHRDRSIWRGIASGEMYRVGEGWLWPDPSGCRIKPGSAQLCIPNLGFPIARIFLHMRGLGSKSSTFSIHTQSGLVFSSTMNAGQGMWAVFDVEVDREGCVCFDIRSADYEAIVMDHGGSPKRYAAGISVLGFCVSNKDDHRDRLDFLEAAANNKVEYVGAFAKNCTQHWT